MLRKYFEDVIPVLLSVAVTYTKLTELSVVSTVEFVRVLENLKSHGILFFSFPGLESH